MDRFNEFLGILEAFKETFHCQVTLHVFARELNYLKWQVQELHNNPFCSFVKEVAGQSERCRYFDDLLPQQSLVGNLEPYFKYCHGRVIELLAPVKVNGHLGGLLYFGPFNNAGDEFPPGTVKSTYFCRKALLAKKKHLLPSITLEEGDRMLKLAKLVVMKLEIIASQTDADAPCESRKELIERFLEVSFKYSHCSLKNLADHLGLSQSRTTQVLREEFRMGFPALLNTRRIDFACNLLKQTYFSASKIAILAGFNTPAYFFSVFKKHTGMTADQFRKANPRE